MRNCLSLLFVYCLIVFNGLLQPTTLFAEDQLPRVVLIGDSTVKNGSGKGEGGMWGWGQVLADFFDTERIEVENHALGGRSSRSFLTEGLWEKALQRVRPGDYVLMQFGHNDGGQYFKGNRPRASIKGNGEETEQGVVEMTGKEETVHSFGWYLRRYIADTKAKGATPIVVSLIPRNRWKDGKVIRDNQSYALWARQAAEQGGAHFLDLNELVAQHYEQVGAEQVSREYFTEKDWTHTTFLGAVANAECVATGLQSVQNCALDNYLRRQPLGAEPQTTWRFDFGKGEVASDFQQVLSSENYDSERGYGYEPGSETTDVKTSFSDPKTKDASSGDAPFYFSAKVAPGNYRVRVWGGTEPLTVKAELRRLMTLGTAGSAENPAYAECIVNVRNSRIPGGEQVRLKPREKTSEAWAWDDRLTLEISGDQPTITALEIEPAPEVPTVFLMGDSTVCDQPVEPWNSWGQMLTLFFKPEVAIANHSESGESVRGAWGERRFDKIFTLMRPGDYLFIQFGHNDMKSQDPNALARYRQSLGHLVRWTRDLRATPVLVTSMERKRDGNYRSLGEYPQTMRDLAQELEVPLIDLNEISKTLYPALGDDLDLAFQDGTHHTNYGSYLFAQAVVQGIRDNNLELAKSIVDNFKEFDPEHPLPHAEFSVPASPAYDITKPEGS